MNDTEKQFYGCLGLSLTYFVTIVLGTILNGYVLTILWG